MGKKPIVSVTYENETISINNSLPYLKCVLRLSSVVHAPIYGRFMGFYVNGFLSIVMAVLWVFNYVNDRFFSHTNPYIANVTPQCRCSPMLVFRAWATCDTTVRGVTALRLILSIFPSVL